MDQSEEKQHAQNQRIGLFLVVFGAAGIALGCHFHYAELTTAAALINGAGINMLTNQTRQKQACETGQPGPSA